MLPLGRDGALGKPTIMASRGIVKVDLNAVDVGTGVLTLYYWLVEVSIQAFQYRMCTNAAAADPWLIPQHSGFLWGFGENKQVCGLWQLLLMTQAVSFSHCWLYPS